MMNTKLKAVLAFLIIFIAGFATGFLISNSATFAGDDQRGERTEQTDTDERINRDDRDERQASRARNRLINMLDLSENQEEPFFEHFSQYRSNLRSDIREMRERESELLKEHYQAFKNELSNVLNTEQLNKLDRQLHPDSVRHHHRSRGPGTPDRRSN
jgi:hypothetical protein